MRQPAPKKRCAAVWFLVSGAVACVQFWLLGDLVTAWEPATDQGASPLVFDDLLTSLAVVVLAACAVWFWIVTTVVVIEALRGVAADTAPRSSFGCPASLRQALLVACGLALSTALAASAQADPQQQARPANSLVSGLPLPDRAQAPAQSQPQPKSQTQRQHTVRSGDTLWGIAADALGPASTDAEIAFAWHAIHENNRQVIGADPDLIQPGAKLAIPDLQEEAP